MSALAEAFVSFGVFQCIGAPIGLRLPGVARARSEVRTVLAVVLAIQTVAITVVVTTGPAERSSLRTATVS